MMNRLDVRWTSTRRIVGSCSLAVLVAVQMAGAEGFRNPPEGAGALGHSGGKLTLTEDASLVSHNPAGLTALTQPQAMAAFTLVNAEAEFESAIPMLGSAKTKSNLQWLPALYAAMPLREGRYVVGLGLTTPYGQATEWSKDSLFRYAAPYFAELRTLDVSPALAVRLNDKLSAGVAADFMASDLDFRQVFPWAVLTGVPMTPDGEAKFSADGEGVGGHAGLRWAVTPRQTMALTYRSPIKVDYEGDFRVSGVPAGFPLPSDSSEFDAIIRFPSVVAAGYRFQILDNLRVAMDVEWIEFSRYDKLVLDIGPLSSLLPQTAIPQDWKDSWTAGLGADWQVSDALTLRGGYMFIESPIPSSTLAPTLPDADRHLLSLGAGYAWKRHRVDLAYAFSVFQDRDVKDQPNPLYNGTYDLSSQLLGVSYGVNF